VHTNLGRTRIVRVTSNPTSYPTPKLVLDKTLSAVLLIVLSPVFAFLVVAIGLDGLLRPRDQGPWLYRERRISRGREFDLLKFRTLRRDVLARIDPAESHARLHEADESNLTWAGRRLLKPRYLDELPQIWNVFRGDMSLVGPRPWPPSMVARQVAEGATYRNEFVAGWTGPAQVEKGAIESTGYAELDRAYVDVCRRGSAWGVIHTDFGILRRTIAVLAKGEGLRF
jgi:O-antigen biosynthesis protein WbqP